MGSILFCEVDVAKLLHFLFELCRFHNVVMILESAIDVPRSSLERSCHFVGNLNKIAPQAIEVEILQIL